jgi:hypothetical protein
MRSRLLELRTSEAVAAAWEGIVAGLVIPDLGPIVASEQNGMDPAPDVNLPDEGAISSKIADTGSGITTSLQRNPEILLLAMQSYVVLHCMVGRFFAI